MPDIPNPADTLTLTDFTTHNPIRFKSKQIRVAVVDQILEGLKTPKDARVRVVRQVTYEGTAQEVLYCLLSCSLPLGETRLPGQAGQAGQAGQDLTLTVALVSSARIDTEDQLTPAIRAEWARCFPNLPPLDAALESEDILIPGDGEDDPPTYLAELALHLCPVMQSNLQRGIYPEPDLRGLTPGLGTPNVRFTAEEGSFPEEGGPAFISIVPRS